MSDNLKDIQTGSVLGDSGIAPIPKDAPKTFGTPSGGTLELFPDQKPEPASGPGSRCHYSRCRKILGPDKRMDAQHCNNVCRAAAYKEKKLALKANIKYTCYLAATEWMQRHPHIFNWLAGAILHDKDNKKLCSFRWYWETARKEFGVTATNSYQKPVRLELERQYPEIQGCFREWKSVKGENRG